MGTLGFSESASRDGRSHRREEHYGLRPFLHACVCMWLVIVVVRRLLGGKPERRCGTRKMPSAAALK